MWSSKCLFSLIFMGIFAMATHVFGQTNDLPRISALEASNYLNQQVIVVDKVVQVAMRSNIWLLHLNLKYPKSPLNGTIRKGFTNDFPNLNDYLGHRVEITGRITDYRGRLEIPLTSTNQIRILKDTETNAAAKPAAVVPLKQAQAPEPTHPTVAVTAAPPAETPVSQSPANVDNAGSNRTLGGILALLAVISMLLAVGIFLYWRRQTNIAVVPQPTNPLALAPLETATDAVAVEAWKQRALAAEAMAGKQGDLLREKMIPELTEFAKQSLVQGLYAQRNALMETQRKAQEELAQLEARLNTLQAPLHERIRAYEKRIAELEREVETQGEEMRELTRATLTLVRRKLEDERAAGGLQGRFN